MRKQYKTPVIEKWKSGRDEKKRVDKKAKAAVELKDLGENAW